MTNPYASFDILAILTFIRQQLGNASETELHLLSYLSCLLSLYRKKPVSAWGYEFFCSKMGIPFSSDLSNSLLQLTHYAAVKSEGEYYTITDSGTESFVELQKLEQNKERLPFLEAACSSILSLPIGVVRDALINEPSFSNKKLTGGTRQLFDDAGLENLYSQFSALSDSLGFHVGDLMVPAVVWLSYLSRIANLEMDKT